MSEVSRSQLRRIGAELELPPGWHDAALEFAANILRTLSTSYADQPGEMGYEQALRWAARKLDNQRPK